VPRFTSPLGYTPPHLVERILQHRSALEGEYKHVTVMFCDLVESTVLAGRLGPEAMHELLDRFFEAALEIVHLYEGTVNQFLGDGFMALFGAPLAIEHHERQAVMAAVAIRDGLPRRLHDVEARVGRPARMRIGLNTGAVVVGKIGDNLRMDYTAVGDTTNVASRLQGQAEPGSILVSASTYQRARALFSAETLGPLTVTGREEPVSAYRVIGRLPSRSTLDVDTDRVPSRFVGREREIATLHDTLTQVEEERGQVVGIIGDAGLGKSRLLAEFRGTLAGRRLTWLEGRCLPYGAAIPYLPVLDLLRANCRIADADTPEAIAAKLSEALLEVGLDPTNAAPYLLHLLGVKERVGLPQGPGPETIKARTFDTLRELAVRGSRLRPIVFVIEDLHWIDQSSLEFLIELADAVAGASVLLLATYRPGYAPPWAGKSYAMQLALRPLAEGDSLAVIESALGSAAVAPDVRQAIAARGEGNPLFLEELARALSEHADVSAADQIPDTLQGLLMSRIDRLPDDTKLALQIASVIGREFSTQLLEAVWAGDTSLPEHLRELAHQEFLRQRSRSDEPAYVFKHALTRDVVYGSLLQRRRRYHHGAVGSALERLHAGRLDEVVELLAHHFDLSDDADRAVDYAMRAAAKAQRRWANAEALAFADMASRRLTAMPDVVENRRRRIDAVLRQCEVRFALGQHAAQVSALEELRAVVTESADPPRRAAWHYWMGFLHSLTGSRPDVAIDYCREAAAIAEREGLEEIGAYADSTLAQAYLVAGDLANGLDVGERALAVFERRGDRWWASRTLAHLSTLANASGAWERSLGYCHRALQHGQAMDDLRLKVAALARIGGTHVYRGDPRTGLEYCQQALDLGATPFDAAMVRAIRGYGLVKLGRVDEGVRALAEVLEWYERSQLTYTRSLFALWLVEGYLRLGEPERALPLVRAVAVRCDELGYRHLGSLAARLEAEAIARDDPAMAISRLSDAVHTLDAVGARGEAARARLALAALEHRAGDAAHAREHAERALAMLRDLGATGDLLEGRTALAGLFP
jgi:class 3 adenylate cyclase/tetratricopeptide (TPR) repeat protein